MEAFERGFQLMKFAVAQSGGPTCAINASLAGVFLAAAEESQRLTANGGEQIQVLGILHGIQGLLAEQFVDLQEVLSDSRQISLLRATPATALGSCRFRLPRAEQDDSVYVKIREIMDKNAIDVLFYIGGNDSMDTVAKLSAWLKAQGSPIRVIGVPKTIDNDLIGTDHTPGFGSAVKYLAMTMSEIIRDCSVYQVQSVLICEIMGRDAGWLTASTCILRANGETAPHFIYLPESDFSVARFLEDVRTALKTHRSVICAVSEGVKPPDADLFRSGANDEFGHAYLSGIGKYLETQVRREIGVKVRSVELNVMQRCSSHIASLTDLNEAEQCGRYAVALAMQGLSGKMVTMQRVSDADYQITYSHIDAAQSANVIRTFPKTWITDAGNQISDDAIGYFLPLIQGDVQPTMQNGMPVHFRAYL